MFKSESFIRLVVFMSVGYLCAGTVFSVFASIPLFTSYLEVSFMQASLGISASFILSCVCAMVALRYLVPRYGAKAIYEQDVLIFMIGMLFVALTINKAMFIIGLFVAIAALCVYFYENFRRQITVAREGRYFMVLCGWMLGPLVAVLAITMFKEYGLLTIRILFAHYIALAFFVWIQRLELHEDYKDASQILFGSSEKKYPNPVYDETEGHKQTDAAQNDNKRKI